MTAIIATKIKIMRVILIISLNVFGTAMCFCADFYLLKPIAQTAIETFDRKFVVGEQAINVYRDPMLVTVVGIESGGTYALRFEE